MAVIQISKIQVRRGLQENLPALASGELGWSVDQRRLFIGNGTLNEGAPEIGNTEILTVYSNAALGVKVEENSANIAILQTNVTAIQSNLSSFTYQTISFADNTSTATNTAITVNTLTTKMIDYNIIRGNVARIGTIKVSNFNGNVVYDDEYSVTSSTGVNLSFASYGNTAVMQFTTTNSGQAALFNYYLKSFI